MILYTVTKERLLVILNVNKTHEEKRNSMNRTLFLHSLKKVLYGYLRSDVLTTDIF